MSPCDSDDDLPPPLAQRLKRGFASGTCPSTLSSSLSSSESSSRNAKRRKINSRPGNAIPAASTPSVSATSVSALFRAALSSLFACASPAAARRCVSRQKPALRRSLARLAGLKSAWVHCDQKIKSNVTELADQITAELYEPFAFYRGSLARSAPRELFAQHQATRPLSNRQGFWTARGGLVKHKQTHMPAAEPAKTFDAVVHFVQAGSGTGVHVGNGLLLTCAHVVDGRDDDDEEEERSGGGEATSPTRTGRTKVVMFASGRTFLATCVSVLEEENGTKDTAAMVLGAELAVPGVSFSREGGERGGLPFAELASSPAESGDKMFCVGNPSSVDLESMSSGTIDFEPPTWHASVGACVGYVDPAVQEMRDAQGARGRAPTRGERKRVAAAAAVEKAKGSAEGSYLQHTCWTYWGHSGAPLFDARDGKVVGLHCAWDEETGMRHGQKLQHLRAVLEAVPRSK